MHWTLILLDILIGIDIVIGMIDLNCRPRFPKIILTILKGL